MERFLARVAQTFGSTVTLKGGLALELRLANARSTKDIDLLTVGAPEVVLGKLRAAAALDLGDHLAFTIDPDREHPTIEDTVYEGKRFRAVAKLAGQVYGSLFGVDVALGDPMHGPADELTGDDFLDFVGVEPARIAAYPVETHIAEKLHAYTRPPARAGRENSRVRDHPDLALLASTRSFDGGGLRAALATTFAFRATHAVPAARKFVCRGRHIRTVLLRSRSISLRFPRSSPHKPTLTRFQVPPPRTIKRMKHRGFRRFALVPDETRDVTPWRNPSRGARERSQEGPTEAASSRDPLELAQTVEQKRHEAALETLAAAVPRSAQAKRLHEEAHSELVGAESALHRSQAEHNALASLLRAEEESTSDARLRVAVEGATAEAVRCRARDEAALRAWEMAMPEVRRADLERTQRVLLEHGLRTKALLEELNMARGRLGVLLPEGHFDRLAEKQTALEEARVLLARLERQANAVRLLRETAASAYTEAQQRLMEPVYKEALPLLQMIRPGTTIKMNESTLRLEQVRRYGYDEDFEDLSGGAREQLAVVVRVALARVFARQRRAMPLILDDVLGWTDDRRLRSMINVLERTAQDMQIILLTCHPGRFRSVMGASTFELDQLKEATPVV